MWIFGIIGVGFFSGIDSGEAGYSVTCMPFLIRGYGFKHSMLLLKEWKGVTLLAITLYLLLYKY